MDRTVIVEKLDIGHRGAVLEHGSVREWLIDDVHGPLQEGMIIAGRVENVLNGMDAAFIDIGDDKHGYLHIKEHPDYQAWKLQENGKPAPKAGSLLQKGDRVIVQVKKEAAGSKGCSLTMLLSISGTYTIYMPFGGYAAVSKKISDESRAGLRREVRSWLTGQEGIIVRTNAEQAELLRLQDEFELLRSRIAGILQEKPKAPGTLYYDESRTDLRVEKDYVGAAGTEVITNDAELAAQWKRKSPHVTWQNGSLFSAYHLDKELEKSLRPFVWMKNGGSLMIQETEAMTIIDVNSGKYTGTSGMRDTAFEVNMAAAEEISRQLRLRNIGGMVIIDFIEMNAREAAQQVDDTLRKALRRDGSTTNVAGFTKLGNMEMTRKQTRRKLSQLLTEPCTCCSGGGRQKTRWQLTEELKQQAAAVEAEACLFEVPERLAAYLRKETFSTSLPELFIRIRRTSGNAELVRTGTVDEVKESGERLGGVRS
ncbi:ribonuclease E/G [Bacillus daqingensis]|uniref:Ribonuclease E/G n=1 Tax=Bacillus daqingensis TaxID=872396 RepID=A0ABV9NVU6_9BACI